MGTARQELLQSLSEIIKEPYSKEGEVFIKRLLNSYRVQAKPNEDLTNNGTAREELFLRIILEWQKKGPLERKFILKIFLPFRMQIKQGLKSAKIKLKNNLKEDKTFFINKDLGKAEHKKNQENAFFNKKKLPQKDQKPIAGGPNIKTKSRSQCPKCRSLGLVLAPSFTEEDHFSCVYCGYHAFLDTKNPEADLPLAAQILDNYLKDKSEE